MTLIRTILVPLREMALFPSVITPLVFQEEIYSKPFAESLESGIPLGFLALKEPDTRQPDFTEFFAVGTMGKVLQYSRDEKRLLRVVVEGRERFSLKKFIEDVPYLVGEVETINEHDKPNVVTEALTQSIHALLKICLNFGAPLSEEVVRLISNIQRPGKLADLMACYLANDLAEQQEILETTQPAERLKKVFLTLEQRGSVAPGEGQDSAGSGQGDRQVTEGFYASATDESDTERVGRG